MSVLYTNVWFCVWCVHYIYVYMCVCVLWSKGLSGPKENLCFWPHTWFLPIQPWCPCPQQVDHRASRDVLPPCLHAMPLALSDPWGTVSAQTVTASALIIFLSPKKGRQLPRGRPGLPPEGQETLWSALPWEGEAGVSCWAFSHCLCTESQQRAVLGVRLPRAQAMPEAFREMWWRRVLAFIFLDIFKVTESINLTLGQLVVSVLRSSSETSVSMAA